jgi:hypothetical protein
VRSVDHPEESETKERSKRAEMVVSKMTSLKTVISCAKHPRLGRKRTIRASYFILTQAAIDNDVHQASMLLALKGA